MRQLFKIITRKATSLCWDFRDPRERVCHYNNAEWTSYHCSTVRIRRSYYFYLLAHLLLCPSISLSICPPVHLSIYSSVFPSFFLSIRLFIQFSIYPSFVHLCSSCLGFSYPFLPPCTHSYHSSAQRLWGGWPAKSSTGGRDPQLHDQIQWLCTCRLLLLSSRVLVDNYPSWCLASRFHLEWICHLLHQCS